MNYIDEYDSFSNGINSLIDNGVTDVEDISAYDLDKLVGSLMCGEGTEKCKYFDPFEALFEASEIDNMDEIPHSIGEFLQTNQRDRQKVADSILFMLELSRRHMLNIKSKNL